MAHATYDNVTKRFDNGEESIVAVDDLSIAIEDGEFLVLVGPSGCGKSTTLRLLAGLETVTEGTVTLGNKDITDEKPKNRDIAMVFQNYALYPHMSVKENMSFGLEMTTELPATEIADRVTNAAEMLGISELLDRLPSALSGGQKQRVALGRAIVREPAVFLMDEPLSNLDAKLRTQMRTELQQLQTQLDVATVYVTHDQTEAMTMGDRIAVLNHGELQQLATPLDCYHEPANTFVAGFIGSPSMNFLELTFDPESGTASSDAIEYAFTNEQTQQIRDNAVPTLDTITLGIRPEDISVTGDHGPETIEAHIDVVEPMGKESVLHISIGTHKITSLVPGEYDIEAGQTVQLKFPHDRIHVFDPDGDVILNRGRKTESLPSSASF